MGISTGGFALEDVRLPREHLVGEVNRGFYHAMEGFSATRVLIGATCVGAAEALLELGMDHVKERHAFGRPLAANQAIQIRLADMARRITAAQLLSLQLGRLKDAGKMQPTQVSIAKWNNVRMALDIARDCRDILGGSGITTEYQAIRHMLNLESVITYEGTETVHQLVVGRELTGINAF